MSETLKQKAKRVLKKFNFEKDNHCVSLVGADLGHAANGFKTLVVKATNPEEMVEISKALEQVTLKLSMEEFLRKFFDMWSDDAEVLTKLLGFETEHEAYVKANKERKDSEDSYDWEAEHTKWLESRLSQFTLMKSMNDSSVKEIAKSSLNEVVALQQKLEPALIEHFTIKEKQMEELELAKSALTAKEAELSTQVELTKSLEAKVIELEQALSVVKAAEEKAKFDEFAEQLKGLVADEKFENVAKAMYEMHKVNAEVVEVQIEALKSAKQNAQVAADGLTKEQGHSEVQDADQAAKAAEIVKAAKAKEIMNKAILG
jgi:hypothetical protein